MQKFKVEYVSNNSGGDWWLRDDDWRALEAAGWKVDWCKDDPYRTRYMTAGSDRWLGALATSASIVIEAPCSSLAEGWAADMWQSVVHMDPYAAGCSCCGCPHSFYATEVTE